MGNFKGTQGKWIAKTQVIIRHGFYIETVDKSFNNSFIGEVGGGLQSITEIQANALLISKAPEMLKMLEAVLYRIDFSEEVWRGDKGELFEQEIQSLVDSATNLESEATND